MIEEKNFNFRTKLNTIKSKKGEKKKSKQAELYNTLTNVEHCRLHEGFLRREHKYPMCPERVVCGAVNLDKKVSAIRFLNLVSFVIES